MCYKTGKLYLLLTVKIDNQLRDRAQSVAADMGLDLASGVKMFLMQMIRENDLPFRLGSDPFYGARNQADLNVR